MLNWVQPQIYMMFSRLPQRKWVITGNHLQMNDICIPGFVFEVEDEPWIIDRSEEVLDDHSTGWRSALRLDRAPQQLAKSHSRRQLLISFPESFPESMRRLSCPPNQLWRQRAAKWIKQVLWAGSIGKSWHVSWLNWQITVSWYQFIRQFVSFTPKFR